MEETKENNEYVDQIIEAAIQIPKLLERLYSTLSIGLRRADFGNEENCRRIINAAIDEIVIDFNVLNHLKNEIYRQQSMNNSFPTEDKIIEPSFSNTEPVRLQRNKKSSKKVLKAGMIIVRIIHY